MTIGEQVCGWCGEEIQYHLWTELQDCLASLSSEEINAPALTYEAYKAKMRAELTDKGYRDMLRVTWLDRLKAHVGWGKW